MTITQKLQELSELWGKCLISYHKSRDTFHYINQVFTFGSISYEVEHYSYVGSDIKRTFNTREAAELFLVEELDRQIEKCAQDMLVECKGEWYDKFDHGTPDHWNKVLNTLNEIRGYAIVDNIDQIKEMERLNEVERLYNMLRYEVEHAHETLDRLNVPREANSEGAIDFNFELSLSGRLDNYVKPKT